MRTAAGLSRFSCRSDLDDLCFRLCLCLWRRFLSPLEEEEEEEEEDERERCLFFPILTHYHTTFSAVVWEQATARGTEGSAREETGGCCCK